MAREQVTTVPRRQARGDMLPAHQLHRVTYLQAPARDNHRGQGMVSVLLLLNVFLHITVCPATLALNDLFEYFVLPKALKPY